MRKKKNDEKAKTDSGRMQSLNGSRSFHALLVTAVESTAEAIIITDLNGTIQYVNPAFERITGYSRSDAMDQPISILNSGKHDKSFFDAMWDTLQRGDIWQGRILNRKKDGSHFESEATVSPVKNNQGEMINYVSVQRDITHEVQLEKQLRDAQKMEAIGTLAGGIAHDFNNLLMGIQGNISLSLSEIDFDSTLFRNLKKVEQYVQNGVELTKNLLGFAQGGKYEIRMLDVNELLNEKILIFSRANKDISFQTHFASDLWSVEADRGQMDQVILNLFMNAVRAMPDGGILAVETRNVTIEKEQNSGYKIKAGTYIKISVSDTGIGMDEETKRRLFDPFFTTKEMGRGIGLGMASAYGIIKNHEGIITVDSQEGQGTRFDIYLPAEDKPADKTTTATTDSISTKKTVLMVDDEEMIIDVGTRMLNKLGYDVLSAVSGEEAIEVYNQNQHKIDLVILDMVMPQISGGEAFDRLRKLNPDVKVILSSGYSIDGQATEILDRGCCAFIQKPFNLQMLAQTIESVLKNQS
ncbi:MAG: PAS domain S-box protein [Desulfobacterales bacterium]